MTLREDDNELDLSQPFLHLITEGRRTGIPHVVALRFVHQDRRIYVIAGSPDSDWVRNALSRNRTKVRIGEMVAEVRVEPAPQEGSFALAMFRKKYGSSLVRGWYSETAPCLRLSRSSPVSRRGGVRGERDVRTTLSQWRSRNNGGYAGVAEAFDSASEEYDFTIRRNFINRWVRDRSILEVLRIARPEDALLEIGCGTGEEAIRLSKHVSKIVATDIAPRMVALLRRKVEARHLREKIVGLEMGAVQVSSASGHLPGGRARIAYSFNGALNCEPNLPDFPMELSRVVEDRGYFVCSIRNSLCLSEMLVHAAILQFGRATPRKNQPIMVSVGGIDIPAHYYRPGEFARFFRPWFKVRKMVGLPSILPPAYLSDIYFRARRVLSLAERLETLSGSRFPLNRLGDQTLIVFEKA